MGKIGVLVVVFLRVGGSSLSACLAHVFQQTHTFGARGTVNRGVTIQR